MPYYEKREDYIYRHNDASVLLKLSYVIFLDVPAADKINGFYETIRALVISESRAFAEREDARGLYTLEMRIRCEKEGENVFCERTLTAKKGKKVLSSAKWKDAFAASGDFLRDSRKW